MAVVVAVVVIVAVVVVVVAVVVAVVAVIVAVVAVVVVIGVLVVLVVVLVGDVVFFLLLLSVNNILTTSSLFREPGGDTDRAAFTAMDPRTLLCLLLLPPSFSGQGRPNCSCRPPSLDKVGLTAPAALLLWTR